MLCTISAVAMVTTVSGRAVQSVTCDPSPWHLTGTLCTLTHTVTSALWIQTLHIMHTQRSGYFAWTSILAISKTTWRKEWDIIYIQLYMYMYIILYEQIYTHRGTCIYVYKYMTKCTCACTHACTHVHVCVVCMCVCVCTYISHYYQWFLNTLDHIIHCSCIYMCIYGEWHVS